MEKFKRFEVNNSTKILGGQRDKYYYDIDGDGRWDIKIVHVYRRGALVRVIERYR